MLSYLDAVRNTDGLRFVVGESIDNKLVFADLKEIFHLLIAGTTGSGKSVLLNSILLNLISNNSPDSLRFILADTKIVELAQYKGLPHLVMPVAYDAKRICAALDWLSNEMKRRLKLIAQAGRKTLDSYNEYPQGNFEKLPRLVIAIDDISRLAMDAPDSVDKVWDILLNGRAAGVHLIAVTQTPLWKRIKSISTAICSTILFSTPEKSTYRVLLGVHKAEPLAAFGEALFSDDGKNPVKIRTISLRNHEIKSMILYQGYLHCKEVFSNDTMRPIEKSAMKRPIAEHRPPENDELLPAAVDVVLETGQASVSMLQRRLRLGYSRAARLIDLMEERGYVGPFEGSLPRQILITPEQWKNMLCGGK